MGELTAIPTIESDPYRVIGELKRQIKELQEQLRAADNYVTVLEQVGDCYCHDCRVQVKAAKSVYEDARQK